jgi:hypothetical protein
VPVGSRIIEGCLEGLAEGLASGWAWKPGDPRLRLRLQVHVDGKFASEGVADMARPDLAEQGIGDGAHGFRLSLPSRFLDGAPHRVAVVDVDSGVTLTGALRSVVLAPTPVAPKAVEPAAPAAPVPPAPPADPPASSGTAAATASESALESAAAPAKPPKRAKGVLHGFNERRLLGWARDPQQPDGHAMVEIRIDGDPVAILKANLDDEEGGPGRGFAWTPGKHLIDGKAHEVRVRILGEDGELKGSPANLDFSPPPPVLKCHLAPPKGGRIWGWAWDKADPDARQEVQILVDGQPAAILTADQFNEALVRKGMGDGCHSFDWTVDPRFADGREHRLSALVQGIEIGGSPATIQLAPQPRSGQSSTPARVTPGKPSKAKGSQKELKGSLDPVLDLQVAGWVRDKAEPGARLKVEILIDGERQAILIADQFRRSLRERGYDDTRHGYVWTLDRRFADGRPHHVEARVDGQHLTGSPAMFTLAKAKPAGLPPLSVSHLPAPSDPRAAFLAETVLAMRRDAARERQNLLGEVAVLAKAAAAAEQLAGDESAPDELKRLVRDMAAAVETLGSKLARG